MSHIRPLAPQICPICGAKESFHVIDAQVQCAWCGYEHHPGATLTTQSPLPQNEGERQMDELSDAELDALFAAPPDTNPPLSLTNAESTTGRERGTGDEGIQQRRERYRPSYIVKHKGGVDSYAEAIFSTAMDHVRRKDWDGAIHHLRRALDHDRTFTDAHLWMARLLPDEAERREHLKAILAEDMTHGDALRELMILDGELDPDQPVDDFTMPEVRRTSSAAAVSRGVKCPRCGAPKLDADPDEPGLLTCSACGHQIRTASGGDGRSVARALIKRRAQSVVWVVGQRVLHCNGCGAERTFAAAQLAEHCPFCGSRNVVTQDALNSLTQPDSVVPFALDEHAAVAAVRQALSSGIERLKGWFTDNRAGRVIAEGIYLPFWMFDFAADVTRTYRIRDDSQQGYGASAMTERNTAGMAATFTDKYADATYNVPVPGVVQPPAWLLARIGKYEISKAAAYSPETIAQYAAEIYTLDFDKASIEARSIVSQSMRDKYTTATNTEQTISVFTLAKPISYRLVLLPVWAITIHERDRDVRPALVNGQTGKVAFGKAAKSR